ncbi:MAG TPA: winged helix-turn-helix transcriptional regulator [Vicinamibacterales bacterium]|jgi:predicted ArsR family transcriptional regulator|nr:winged helix-turn-helix transcriptional regulator [Vicinamibacterales bacterium]
MLKRQLMDTTRGRIVALLQKDDLAVDDLAVALRLTPNAVRSHITAMERDGVVQRVGLRPGTTRPFQTYQLTPETDQLLSRAYIPFVSQLISVLTAALPADDVERLVREAGRGLARALIRASPADTLEEKAAAASVVLNEELGSLTHVESNGHLVIRGAGCPLSALTGRHPAVCRAMETLVTEMVGAPARECCDRSNRPKCCFDIARDTPST